MDSQTLQTMVIALGVVCLLLLAGVVYLVRRTSSLDRRLAGITRGEDGKSLESILGTHLERVYALNREVDILAERTTELARVGEYAFQKVGLVRFNPFEDTGGNQSFALALLDAHADGFVVSSLHARAGTRIYAKAIVKGKCDTALSGEEAEALKLALASGAGPAKAS